MVTENENVVDLAAKRRERERTQGAKLHGEGKSFAFRVLRGEEFAVGLIEHELPVVFVPAEGLQGFVLSREDARKLGRELIAASFDEIPAEEGAQR